jgi:ATP-binding cassette subfamily B protein
LYKKILGFKKGIRLIIFLIVLSSAIQLIIPFLTQSIVDTGINNHDVGFIYIILLAQFALFTGSVSIDFVRRWILFHIGLRINIDLSNLFAKGILSKKTTYFENKKEGDFLQRIIDNNRVEMFLTNTTLSIFTASLNLLLFGLILLYYHASIFLIFVIATTVSILWISFFMRKRKKLDNKRFDVMSKSRSELLEMINGIEDVKLNRIEKQRLGRWESIQKDLLKIRMKMLELGQLQSGGAIGINQVKNIFITFFSATAVIDGQMTLGEMLAVQFITGQLNAPVREIVTFIQSYQDAELSIDRLSDVVDDTENEPVEMPVHGLKEDIRISNVTYSRGEQVILEDINMDVPFRAKIGIVGESGSGKTTLLKLITKLIPLSDGEILFGKNNYQSVSAIGKNVSCVFQDSYVFSDSIAYNVTLSKKPGDIDMKRLQKVIEDAELSELIKSLPKRLKTKVGRGGKTLSRGQEQRLLIARALYKEANYLFFDEFTNSLDNLTKAKILKTIYTEYSDKTIVSVAHKLEDLKYVDCIYVLDQGKIIEQGSHDSLIKLNKSYKNLHQ